MSSNEDVPPLHDLLNVGLFEVTHNLHISLKAHVILMKLVVPKMPRKVGAEGYGRKLKQSKAFL